MGRLLTIQKQAGKSMDKENSILSYLVKNENNVTELLYALLIYKPFREIVVRLFTNGQFGSSDITWDDMNTQIPIAGARPDLSMSAENVTVLVEIKTASWRGLTANQPHTYLQWLANRVTGEAKYFVALIPPVYDHRIALESHLQSFSAANQGNQVHIIIKTWDEIYQAIFDNDLDAMNLYIRDFSNLLRTWYASPITTFTFAEVHSMYDANVAKSIRKVIKVIEEVARGLEQNGYNVLRIFNKNWFEEGRQYAFDIQCFTTGHFFKSKL